MTYGPSWIDLAAVRVKTTESRLKACSKIGTNRTCAVKALCRVMGAERTSAARYALIGTLELRRTDRLMYIFLKFTEVRSVADAARRDIFCHFAT